MWTWLPSHHPSQYLAHPTLLFAICPCPGIREYVDVDSLLLVTRNSYSLSLSLSLSLSAPYSEGESLLTLVVLVGRSSTLRLFLCVISLN